jgi:uncharacterized membrane protein
MRRKGRAALRAVAAGVWKRPIRRAAIHHALRSYVFGTMILGMIVNSIAALLGR